MTHEPPTSHSQPCQPPLTQLTVVIEQSADPLEILRSVAALRKQLLIVESETVAMARTAQVSFAQIGEALGVSRQAVAKKWAKTSADTAVPLDSRSSVWTVSTVSGRTLLKVRKQGTHQAKERIADTPRDALAASRTRSWRIFREIRDRL